MSVRLNARRGIARRLQLGFAAVLLGCPQLLDDQFETLSVSPDGGLTCIGPRCGSIERPGPPAPPGPPGPPGPLHGDAGPDGPHGPHEPPGPDASAPPVEPLTDAGGDDPTPVTPPACWTLELTETDSVSEASCLGLSGWNQIENDPDEGVAVQLDFENGNVCFEGGVSSAGWAVYNMQLASGGSWNATALGVGGFAFDMTGTLFPPSLQIKYFDGSDFCGTIPVGGGAVLPFSETQRCTGTGSLNASSLQMLRVVFPVASYSVDFCIQIRALPAG